MSMRYYIKLLRLVTPGAARSMGVEAEAPVFVSAGTSGRRQCPACQMTYSPMVYQTGYETVAQHFHGREGGIYLYVVEDPDEQQVRCAPGWLAQMEPIGRLVVHGGIGQVAAVRVLAIEARCMGQVAYNSRTLRHDSHLLTEGRAWRNPAAYQSCDLHPVCDKICVPARNTPFRFTLRDGQVFFSMDH
jgi:hypothetical protein